MCVNTFPSLRLSVAAFELEVIAVLSSIVPLSNETTPLASAVTAFDASVNPKVATSV